MEIPGRPVDHSHRPSVQTSIRKFDEWIDVDDVLDRVTHDWDFLREMVDLFAEHAPTMLEAIEQAIAQQDAAEVKRSAHALKGAIACWSTRTPFQLAMELENRADQNRLNDAASVFVALQLQMEELVSALEEFVREGSAAIGQPRTIDPEQPGG